MQNTGGVLIKNDCIVVWSVEDLWHIKNNLLILCNQVENIDNIVGDDSNLTHISVSPVNHISLIADSDLLV